MNTPVHAFIRQSGRSLRGNKSLRRSCISSESCVMGLRRLAADAIGIYRLPVILVRLLALAGLSALLPPGRRGCRLERQIKSAKEHLGGGVRAQDHRLRSAISIPRSCARRFLSPTFSALVLWCASTRKIIRHECSAMLVAGILTKNRPVAQGKTLQANSRRSAAAHVGSVDRQTQPPSPVRSTSRSH